MSERTRTVTWSDPLLTSGAAAGKTGLEFLRAILDGSVPPPPISASLMFSLASVSDGEASFRCVPHELHYNPMGSVHGGVVTTLLDSAMGCAVMTTLDAATAYTTVDLSVHLTRGIVVDTGPIVATGKVVHRGGRLATAEGRLVDEKGRLLAHATTTCLLMPR
jgi:uncharacterized protein (TIGR00369 family)